MKPLKCYLVSINRKEEVVVKERKKSLRWFYEGWRRPAISPGER